jgi:hypothetical protein
MNVLTGIRTHDLSFQAIKAFTSDRTATGTGGLGLYTFNLFYFSRLLFIYLFFYAFFERHARNEGTHGWSCLCVCRFFA